MHADIVFGMTNSPPSATVARTQRVLPFAPETVYAAFADARQLARWWGPTGFTNTFDVFDFRPEGRWEFVMHGPDGGRHPNSSVFRVLEPGRTVVIDHVSAPLFTLTVTMTPHPTGTMLSWVQEFADPDVTARIRPIVEPANEQNLDRLAAVLAGGAA